MKSRAPDQDPHRSAFIPPGSDSKKEKFEVKSEKMKGNWYQF